MLLFAKKFEPKPTPIRMNRCNIGSSVVKEDINDYKNIWLNLENKQLRFIDGDWIEVSKKGEQASSDDNLAKLTKSVKSLENENKLNEVKLDILLDLLTENLVQRM
ncbi:unnamed protein product [Hermetia illucens]|uniref:Uncharacterized protein n=1 Tax=Hermetia illucens TaxID=343691 RepID=A0A7R8UQI9_HERIL|nr:protein chibby homolog 1 [Hermetia illucens]XP_037912922.1 protein chibby homolog 1 [Hermetia illucens]XP_037912924.1 protein chibby homolog 1 [Hermetia illucens]CAD7085161.1 unnamed protein product [Hermetia illucens]